MNGRKAEGKPCASDKREGNPNILSIPVHKEKPIKQGLLRDQIAKAGMTVEEFLKLYR